MDTKLIDYEGMRAKGIKLSPRQLHRKVKAGTFPKPIFIGGNTKVWIEAEINAHIEALMKDRDPRAA